MSAYGIVSSLVEFYSLLIFGYILLSWFPVTGLLADVRRTLATLVEPYLSIFRRIIPPIGMIDISPIVAILVLNMFVQLFGMLIR